MRSKKIYSRSRFLLILVLWFFAATNGGDAKSPTVAKNTILFIGDGMGPAMLTATRIYAKGSAGKLHIDGLPYTALVKTHSANHMVTDSAAAATAMATGVKTNNGVVAEDATAIHKVRHGHKLESIMVLAARQGKATGIVTTDTATNATPAAFYAHHHNRRKEKNIAAQFVDSKLRPDLLLGGGRKYWLPRVVRDPETKKPGTRKDGRNLVEELQEAGYHYVWNKKQFDQINVQETKKLLGLFEGGKMRFDIDRQDDRGGEPSLVDMTLKAIAILSQDPDGFLLVVENEHPDTAAHQNDTLRMLHGVEMLDKAVGAVLKVIDKSTLLLVTADHDTGGLSINGPAPLATQGEALLGKTRSNTLRRYPYLSWSSGPGMERRPMSKDAEREHFSPSLIQRRSALHTAVDVLLAAKGPGAEAVHGFLDNRDIFTIIRNAMNL